jgi:hypothetical protein
LEMMMVMWWCSDWLPPLWDCRNSCSLFIIFASYSPSVPSDFQKYFIFSRLRGESLIGGEACNNFMPYFLLPFSLLFWEK